MFSRDNFLNCKERDAKGDLRRGAARAGTPDNQVLLERCGEPKVVDNMTLMSRNLGLWVRFLHT